MRQTLLGLTLVLGIAATASAQSLLRVEITDGEFRSGMRPVTTPYATGGPWAAVKARALRAGVDPTVAHFRIRSWVEGDGVRVLVFAVRPGPGGTVDDEREEQIASVLVPADQSVEIAATEKYNARRIAVIADRVEFRPYTVQYHGIDLPMRPWTPPPR